MAVHAILMVLIRGQVTLLFRVFRVPLGPY